MRRSALLLAGFLLAAPAHAAQPGTPTPTTRKLSVPPIVADSQPASQATLTDIAKAYDSMEQSIEVMFAKLIQEAKGNKDALEDQIQNIDAQIEKLKQTAQKIQ